MKATLLLPYLFVGAQSFAPTVLRSTTSTSLFAAIPSEEMTSEDKEIKKIQQEWSEIRHYDRATAESKLDGEWLEAYNRFHQQYDDDIARMKEITQKLASYYEPHRVQKKTKGQKKRDAYARKLERSGQSP